MALGSYPAVSLADARKARDAAKQQKAAGVDPVQARKVEKLKGTREGGDTFKAVALEWHAKQESEWSPGHADRTKRQLERDLLQHLNQEMSQFQEAPLPPGPLAAIGLAWRPDASHLLADTFMLADHRMYEHKRTSKISPHLASALAQGSLCIAD